MKEYQKREGTEKLEGSSSREDIRLKENEDHYTNYLPGFVLGGAQILSAISASNVIGEYP